MTHSTRTLRQALIAALFTLGACGCAKAQGQCLRFFKVASPQELGVFNNCGECRIATVNRFEAVGSSSATAGMRTFQTEHRVPAHGSVQIQSSKPSMELLGDRPCAASGNGRTN